MHEIFLDYGDSLYRDLHSQITSGDHDAVRRIENLVGAWHSQFLEMMATALAYERDEFIAAAARATRAERLNSMCTVFAQSEVVSLIARGASREEIALGVHQAIASRTAALAGGVPLEETIVFTGGCARNPRLVSLLGEALKRPLHVPPEPQTVAALGCALGGTVAEG